MKTIVLLDTAAASFNLGDEIINRSLKMNWPELFLDNYVFKMPTHTPTYKRYQIAFYKKKFDMIKNVDLKILCGTNALYTNMFRPMPNWNINILNTQLFSNTIVCGGGIGINSTYVNLYTKELYRKVLSKEYIHSTRDEKTKEFLEKLGFQAVNTGCPTLWGLTEEFCRTIPKCKSEEVVFTINASFPDVSDKKMIEILLSNYKKVYFWPQCYEDVEYFERINSWNSIRMISPNVDSFDSFLLEHECDYVGNRLHGGIFALQHHRRSIIISIDYRAKEMQKTFSFVYMDRNVIADHLDELIRKEWTTQIAGINMLKIKKWKSQFFEG